MPSFYHISIRFSTISYHSKCCFSAHYLKLGSTRERIEKEILQEQKALLQAKTENLQSQKRTEELYRNALDAMRIYTGGGHGEDV